MPPVGFEPTIPEGERPQTYALDSAATGIELALNKKEYTKTRGRLWSNNRRCRIHGIGKSLLYRD